MVKNFESRPKLYLNKKRSGLSAHKIRENEKNATKIVSQFGASSSRFMAGYYLYYYLKAIYEIRLWEFLILHAFLSPTSIGLLKPV